MVTRPIPESHDDPFGECAKGETCFLCGKIVHDPAILWSGMTGKIYLHGSCAISLSGKLINDVHQLYTGGIQPRKEPHESLGEK